MSDIAGLPQPLMRSSAQFVAEAPGTLSSRIDLTVETTHRIDEVEAIWRALAAPGIESPGQSFDFIRLWVEAQQIAPADQLYVVGRLDGRPIALLPLHRRREHGVRLYSWFPGAHVGCNAPLVDAARLAALSPAQRAALWRGMLKGLDGADLVYLKAVPTTAYGREGLFAELGEVRPVETLYRSVFPNWETCNTTQRSKSRRKHDRQQGERLDALGTVSFEEITCRQAARPVLAEMFRQRAKRFVEMGVKDPFAPCGVARFYDESVAPDSKLDVRLHVLRLDGEIVAVRYSVAHGDRLFCLISSMSDDPRMQGGSPGKQCLLRVMQTVFDAGFSMFDMGAGFTDEKRHWCNEQIGLGDHYLPLNLRGKIAVALHGQWMTTRARIKANKTLLDLAKRARGLVNRSAQPAAKPADTDASD